MVFGVSDFEGVPSKPRVGVHRTRVMSSDSGPIDHTLGGAPSREGAVIPPAHLTVAASLLVVVGCLLHDLGVMSVYVVFNVRHAPIANLDGVSVHNFVQWVVFGEVFGNYSKELGTNICFHIFGERWVEPCDFSPSVFTIAGTGMVVVVVFIIL